MLFREYRSQVTPRFRLFAFGNLLGSSRSDNATAVYARIRAKVNNPVRALDHIEVVFNHHDAVAETTQAIQAFEQSADIFKMEARRRFIEQVKRLARPRAAQFRSNLHTLRFATTQSCGGLPKRKIAKTHFAKELERFCNFRNVLEKFSRIADAHVENFGDVLAFKINFTSRFVKALAVAHIASDLHTRQNVHVDDLHARAFASITAATLHIKAEAALRVATHLAFFHTGKEVANVIPNFRVSSRVASRSASNRRLVNFDDLVDVFETFQVVKLADRFFGIVEHAGKFTAQNLVHKRTLARARNARDYCKRTAKRDFNINVPEIVFASTANLELWRILVNSHALRWNFNRLATAQIGTRK